MAYETLLYEVADEIATITLNRPAKMNAYTAQMGHEMADAMLRADADDSARVVIMTGAGERAFCAGADMGMFADNIKAREAEKPAGEERRGGAGEGAGRGGAYAGGRSGRHRGGEGEEVVRGFLCIRLVCPARS